MNLEEQIKKVLKEDSVNINSTSNYELRRKIKNRISISKFSKKRKNYIAIPLVIILVFGISATVFAKNDILNVFSKFNIIKHGESSLQGVMFKGGKSSAAFDEPSKLSTIYNNYSDEITNKVGMKFPKLLFTGINVNKIRLDEVDELNKKFEILTDATLASKNKSKNDQRLSFNLFHNTTKDLYVEGNSINPGEDSIVNLNGTNAKLLSFSNDDNTSTIFILWKHGEWTIVLQGYGIPKETMIEIAKNSDQQISDSH